MQLFVQNKNTKDITKVPLYFILRISWHHEVKAMNFNLELTINCNIHRNSHSGNSYKQLQSLINKKFQKQDKTLIH
jgi:hypothetical protein